LKKEQTGITWTDKQKRIIDLCASTANTIWDEKFADEISKAFSFKCEISLLPKNSICSGVTSISILSQIAKHCGFEFSDRTKQYITRGSIVKEMANELLDWKSN